MADLIEAFEATIMNAMDLYPSMFDCVKYFFPNRSLKDLLMELVESNELNRKIAKEFADRFFVKVLLTTRTALSAFALENGIFVDIVSPNEWEPFVYCNGSLLKKTVIDCLVLLHLAYEARSVPNLISAHNLDQIEVLRSAAAMLIGTIDFKQFGFLLPEIIHETYGVPFPRKQDMKDCINRRKDCFIVENNNALNEVNMEVNSESAEFINACDHLFLRLSNNDCDIQEIQRSFEPLVNLLKVDDLHLVDSYLRLLCKFFMNSQDLNKVMRDFFTWCIEKYNCLPEYSEKYMNYANELSITINKLSNWAHSDEKSEAIFYSIYKEIASFVFISPKKTLWILLSQCLENQTIVPKTIKLFRLLPSLLELNVKDPTSDHDVRIPIVLFALRKLLGAVEEILEDKERDVGSNYVYLASALSRIHYKTSKNSTDSNESIINKPVLHQAIVSGNDIFFYLVLPELFTSKHMCYMLTLILRMLSFSTYQRTSLIWSSHIKENDDKQISAPGLLLLLADMNGAKQSSEQISSLCFACLKALAIRLREDKIVLDEEICGFILKKLNNFYWSVKYAIVSWFFDILQSPKREVPTGIFLSLSPKCQKNFVQIIVDFDFSPTTCFLQSIFELAFVDSQLALELIDQGFSITPLRNNLGVKMAQAVVDAMPDEIASDKVIAVLDIIKALVDLFDPPRDSMSHIEFSESSFYGLRLIEPLLIFGDASLYSAEQEFFSDVRPIPEKVIVNRYARVSVQAAQLFCYSCIISQHVKGVPKDLQLLLLTLIDHHNELRNMVAGPILDFMETNSRAGKVVHAYCNVESNIEKTELPEKNAKIVKIGEKETKSNSRTAEGSESENQSQITLNSNSHNRSRNKRRKKEKNSEKDTSEESNLTSAANRLFQLNMVDGNPRFGDRFGRKIVNSPIEKKNNAYSLFQAGASQVPDQVVRTVIDRKLNDKNFIPLNQELERSDSDRQKTENIRVNKRSKKNNRFVLHSKPKQDSV
ncbi:unnamed protein product [Dracunculus medinensis]|uniref:NUC173 domain-containing protein n=1 Tax=Dracunculus medinensis TaxID=318479 RepID=A0A0N4U3A5_DRAME|nr:unnamed protein product [Dracunculus medinensis]